MNAVTLSPDLERFVADAVASGRNQDMLAVVEAGVSLLRRTEAARGALLASVLGAQNESDREFYLTAEDLTAVVEARLSPRTQRLG